MKESKLKKRKKGRKKGRKKAGGMKGQLKGAGSGFLNLILLSSFGYCKAMRQHMLDFQLNAGRFFLSATAHLGLALGFGGLFVMTSFLCSGCASGFAAL